MLRNSRSCKTTYHSSAYFYCICKVKQNVKQQYSNYPWTNFSVCYRFLVFSLCISRNKSVFSLFNSAANMALPAYAAKRHAAAPLLQGTRRRCSSIFLVHTALSSKSAARRCCGRMMGQTDRRTNTRSLHTLYSALHTMQSVPIKIKGVQYVFSGLFNLTELKKIYRDVNRWLWPWSLRLKSTFLVLCLASH